MKTIGIAELKAHLSRCLDVVKHGQEVVVTDRGRPIAKIVPIRPSEGPPSRRERLVKAGLLHPAAGRLPARLLKPPTGPPGGFGVLKALLAEREEAR
jgi:prevent-host-death family protein